MNNWQRIWDDDESSIRFSPTRTILYILSLLYRLIINFRNRLYDKNILTAVKLPCPVISVGNITVGGTGKTPCVIMLAQMLKAHGFRPAVLSRGYGGKGVNAVNIVSDGERILLDAAIAGDEPLLIAQSLSGVPVLTGPRRIETGETAINKYGANIVICDDAFQHRQIFRDVDLVLLDSEKPLGNGYVLPRGELREPAYNLRRASCFILTRADEAQPVNEIISNIAQAGSIPIFHSTHQPKEIVKGDYSFRRRPEELKGKRVCAFCGIANPDSFKKLLQAGQAQILSFDPFPDHYRFSRYDLDELKNKFINLRADYLITTQKDVMRLQNFPEFLKMLCMMRIEMEIIPSLESFERYILERLAAAARPAQSKSN